MTVETIAKLDNLRTTKGGEMETPEDGLVRWVVLGCGHPGKIP